MHNFKLTLQYDGSDFKGWQVQPKERTVQATLEEALAKILGGRLFANASGRTDTGVHAIGQVVNFLAHTGLPSPTLLKAINANLPDDVVIRDLVEVPHEFNANRDAIRKCYRYVIRDHPIADPFQRKYAYHVFHRLDAQAMAQASLSLIGTHDFHSFETEWPNRASSVRTITRLSVNRAGEMLWIDVEANGFLYNMVRAIAGTLINVGRGFWPVSQVAEIVRLQDRKHAGPTAPACGLYLMRVTYP